ncbi:MAG: hypothetical protein P1P84_05450 [Deferrisomatales bacterium]|nr:hypothetical protein [Deferrisomatales bacterium]
MVALASGTDRVGDAAKSLIRISADAAPTPEGLTALAGKIEAARYADDVGFDLRHLVLGAKHMLASGLAGSPDAATLAIEIMADHALKPLGETKAGELLFTSVKGPVDVAHSIAKGGLPVVMLGVAENGLTRVDFTDENVTAHVEAVATFSTDALREWRGKYPYEYQDPRHDTSHDFYTSTEHLGVTALPERAVIVAGTELQAFPPNLLQIDGALAGETRRLALAPSLGWLEAARRTPWLGDGRIQAWIPDALPAEGLPALAVLAERLRESFEHHGVSLSSGGRPPSDLEGSDMVIVAAHGGLGEDKRFFRVVADDVDLALAASTLSGALSRVGVVVLFVCSGGRIDKHPGASTTVGLAKQLLHRGCRAVVAPPWPLSTSVPPHWLPVFLDRWMLGAAIIDACFEANAAVRESFGASPDDDLAMAVYGDPLASRTA